MRECRRRKSKVSRRSSNKVGQGRSSNLHESIRGYGREMDWSFGKVGE